MTNDVFRSSILLLFYMQTWQKWQKDNVRVGGWGCWLPLRVMTALKYSDIYIPDLSQPSTACFMSGSISQAWSPRTSMQGVLLTPKLLLSTTFRASSSSFRSSNSMTLSLFTSLEAQSICSKSHTETPPGLLWPQFLSALFNENHSKDCRLW